MDNDDREFFQEQFHNLDVKLDGFDTRIRGTEQDIIEIKTEIKSFKAIIAVFGIIWTAVIGVSGIIVAWIKGD